MIALAKSTPPPRRTLFAAGKLQPKTANGSKPCSDGNHFGPLVGTAPFEAHPWPMWRDFGICRACGSTVHKRQIRGAA